MAVLRILGAIIAGMLVSFVLVVGVEIFSNIVHPFPSEFGGTMEEMCQHVERYPAWVLAVVIPVWGGIAFLGTWIARRIGNLASWGTVGLLLLASVVFNVTKLPYPLWFKVATLVVVPVAILAAGQFRLQGKPVTAAEAQA